MKKELFNKNVKEASELDNSVLLSKYSKYCVGEYHLTKRANWKALKKLEEIMSIYETEILSRMKN